MRFRRTDDLPAYVFAAINQHKAELLAQGKDIIDFGMGNPDGPTPAPIVERVCAAARDPRNHGYAHGRGIPELRAAAVRWYHRSYGVELDAESEMIITIGAKDAVAHLTLATAGAGDAVLVPSPTYPLHRFSARFADAEVVPVRIGPGIDFAAETRAALARAKGPVRLLTCSFPHNPTTAVADDRLFDELIALAKKHDFLILHDFAYAHFEFGKSLAPSILTRPGARDVAVEVVSLSKSYNMAGYRIAYAAGNQAGIRALTRIKSYLDYGSFAAIQHGAIVALDQGEPWAAEICEIYRRRAAWLARELTAAGWSTEPCKSTMFMWLPLPDRCKAMGSMKFAARLMDEAEVGVAPGVGFGEEGEGFVRFALIADEARTIEACQRIERFLARV
jgi:alanine-synthesizing transaminase